MMFTRTKNGLKNIHKFHGVDLIVYIEGKESDNKFDKNFYKKLFDECSNYTEVKIKPIGNSNNVLEMYEKIAYDDQNSICIIDRDYSDIKYSYIHNSRLKFTYGYSWENDFWSDKLIMDTIDFCSGGNISKIQLNLEQLISLTKNHAFKICCLDCISQLYDISILDKKKSTFGLSFNRDFKKDALILRDEQIRIRRKAPIQNLKDCVISKSIYKNIFKAEKNRVIQGHFWEAVALHIIKLALSNLSDSCSVPFDFIKNIARTLFLRDFYKYIEQNVREYYSSQFLEI